MADITTDAPCDGPSSLQLEGAHPGFLTSLGYITASPWVAM
jgi:hypothetical protein